VIADEAQTIVKFHAMKQQRKLTLINNVTLGHGPMRNPAVVCFETISVHSTLNI